MDLIIFTDYNVLTDLSYFRPLERHGHFPTHPADQRFKSHYITNSFPNEYYWDFSKFDNTNYRVGVNSNQENIYYGTKNDAFLQDEFYFLNKQLGFHADFFVASKDLGTSVSVMRNWELGGALEDQLWNLPPGLFGTDGNLWGQFQKPNPGMPLLTEQLCKYFFEDGEYGRKIYVGDSDTYSGTNAYIQGVDKQAAEKAGFEFFTVVDFVKEFVLIPPSKQSKSSHSDYLEGLPSRRLSKLK